MSLRQYIPQNTVDRIDDNYKDQKYERDYSARFSSEETLDMLDEDDKHQINDEIGSVSENEKQDKPVSWLSLPRKDQLFIIAFGRLAEPIVQISIHAYTFFMLRSFDASLSDSTISSQAGILSAGFTGGQCFTAVFWGYVADKPWMGRKNVIIIGLLGTLISTVGFGFSRSFGTAFFFRCLGGVLNGNVSVLRTMTSENVREKKYQIKAYLLMPIMFNVGCLLGPLFGGYLQDPVHTFPHVFGPGSKLGGADGVAWMLKFPYALPNLMNGLLLLIAVLLVIFGLEETHMDRKHLPDYGLKFGRSVARILCCRPRQSKYSRLQENANDLELTSLSESSTEVGVESSSKPPPRPKLPLRHLLRRNVLATFLAHGLMAGHISGYQNLWYLFLSTPRFDPANPEPANYKPHPPIFFTGGLGLSPVLVGSAISLNGAIGLMLQFGVYSWITSKLGVVYTYRYALALFPIVYTLAPFLALVPTRSESPHAADGPLIWIGICSLLLVVVTGRTFSQPSSLFLINNCTPHPSLLSITHSIAQSMSAGSRTLAPLIFSSLYGEGLKKGVVGMGWWFLTIQAFATVSVSWLLYEGNGHEIRLEGDL